MTNKKRNGIQPSASENEYVESIVDILDKEMVAKRKNPGRNDPSNEMDLLVSDLLKYLKIEE